MYDKYSNNFNIVDDYAGEGDLPYLRSVIEYGDKIATNDDDIICYINSDIIISERFKLSLNFIETLTEKNFLMVGTRWDLPNQYFTKEINFSKTTFNIYCNNVIKYCTEHNPGGLDYFAYKKGFYDINQIPLFLLARGRFDHWLIGYALEGNNPVIDASKTNIIIQPEPSYRFSGMPMHPDNIGLKRTQLINNINLFYKARKHGQIDMAKYYLDINSNNIIEVKTRDLSTVPVNEFGFKIMGGSLK